MILLRSTYSGTPDEVGALREAHLEWLGGLVADGVVIAAGRFEDGSGAGVLGAGSDAAALLKDFDADPYVVGGVASYAEVATFPAAMGGDEIKRLDARELPQEG
ncbi:MAG: YciI family protein [Solirubrobacteraceae bacterium]